MYSTFIRFVNHVSHNLSPYNSAMIPLHSASLFQLFLARVIAFLLPQLGVRSLNADYMSSIPEEVCMYMHIIIQAIGAP